MALVKYRFYRRDSQRGTTQASVPAGPKLPTGRTDLKGTNGVLLPATLQPGSGSTDLFVGANWTYTGLFNLRRLVADEDSTRSFVRRERGRHGLATTSNHGSGFHIDPTNRRTSLVRWFIGPVLTYLHSGNDRIAGITQNGSGGDV